MGAIAARFASPLTGHDRSRQPEHANFFSSGAESVECDYGSLWNFYGIPEEYETTFTRTGVIDAHAEI